jgi:hypothetical protein
MIFVPPSFASLCQSVARAVVETLNKKSRRTLLQPLAEFVEEGGGNAGNF